MNVGMLQGFSPNGKMYPTSMQGRVVLDSKYVINSNDMGMLLVAQNTSAYSWVLPSSFHMPIDPLTFFHIAFRGTSTLALKLPSEGITYVLGTQFSFAAGSTVNLIGPDAFLSVMKGFGTDWYISGSGWTP